MHTSRPLPWSKGDPPDARALSSSQGDPRVSLATGRPIDAQAASPPQRSGQARSGGDHPIEHDESVRHEPVHVRVRVEQGRDVPDLILCGERLWSVRKILDYEVGTAPRSGDLAEHVWWVVAAVGRAGGERVCELGQAYPSGRWRVRSVTVEMPRRFQCTSLDR